MNIGVLLLVLLSFIQASLLPFDLVILIILVRSFLVVSNSNYYLAMGMGVIVSLLTGLPLGSHSLMYIIAVKMMQLLKKSAFASHLTAGIALTVVILMIYGFSSQWILGISYDLKTLLFQILLFFPSYLVIIFLEDRITINSDIRLKIN